MAGKARLAAAMTQLEVEACKLGLEVGELVTEHIANGGTLLGMAEDYTRKSGVDISRNTLDRAIKKLCPELDMGAARKESAHAIIEQGRQAIADLGTVASKEEIALARLKMSSDQWLAERLNRTDYGQGDKGVTINLNLNRDLHLQAIREGSLEDARRLRGGVEDVVDAEVIPDAEDLI